MTLGDKIRALRIERGLSQNELALACGYKSRASINKIELGSVDLPLNKIQLIAGALDVSPAALIVDENNSSYPAGLISDEARLLSVYRSLTQEGKEKAQAYLSDIAIIYNSEKNNSVSVSDDLKKRR